MTYLPYNSPTSPTDVLIHHSSLSESNGRYYLYSIERPRLLGRPLADRSHPRAFLRLPHRSRFAPTRHAIFSAFLAASFPQPLHALINRTRPPSPVAASPSTAPPPIREKGRTPPAALPPCSPAPTIPPICAATSTTAGTRSSPRPVVTVASQQQCFDLSTVQQPAGAYDWIAGCPPWHLYCSLSPLDHPVCHQAVMLPTGVAECFVAVRMETSLTRIMTLQSAR
ncbi:B3 domain-containing protein LFL1-like [Oryza glaberrima]|uniref:B3 domain-containing protein LFL1-like n=1 Tax=Oryza glaberrima TaxID=4538 RepID=UPI00224C5138|nr:B3 domain-containing protein LFL1-like [Oryza glaberrima]